MKTEIANFFLPILLAIVGFFLLQFYQLVQSIKKDLTELLVNNAKRDQQLENLEGRVDDVETEVKEIKIKISK